MIKWWFRFYGLLLGLSRRANVVKFYGSIVLDFGDFWVMCMWCVLLTSSKISILMLFLISFSLFLSCLPRRRLGTINQIQCLCVLESDFGFSINCNFKKSGLFRVRNLGGLKAHFGLGKRAEKNLKQILYINYSSRLSMFVQSKLMHFVVSQPLKV